LFETVPCAANADLMLCGRACRFRIVLVSIVVSWFCNQASPAFVVQYISLCSPLPFLFLLFLLLQLDELIAFLSDLKPEVRLIAVSNLVTVDGSLFSEKQLRDVVEALSRRLAGSFDFTKVALSLLINVCGLNDIVMDTLLARRTIGSVCALVSDAETPDDVVELASMLLANMTRSASAVLQFLELDADFAGRRFLALVAKFLSSKEKAEERDSLGWLALVLQNCSQVVDARRFLLDKNRSVMRHLSEGLRRFKTTRRRRGMAATIRNCLLDTEHHVWLVEPPVNLAQVILLKKKKKKKKKKSHN
jgi:hypothetical protein